MGICEAITHYYVLISEGRTSYSQIDGLEKLKKLAPQVCD